MPLIKYDRAGVTSNSSKPSNGNESQGPQSFLRGVKDINALPQWEREEILKKQKNQNDVQVSVILKTVSYFQPIHNSCSLFSSSKLLTKKLKRPPSLQRRRKRTTASNSEYSTSKKCCALAMQKKWKSRG